MLANRLVLAWCSIALWLLACNEGGSPIGPQETSTTGAAAAAEQEEQDEEPAEEEDDATPEREQPDEIGLPCAVKELLTTRCQGCHGADAKNGTPLLTREHLIAEAKKDPTVQVIERVLLRVTASEKPMPPPGKGEPLSEDELATLRSWSEQGAPAGRCDGP